MTGGSVESVYSTCAFRNCTFDGVKFSGLAALKEDVCNSRFTGCTFRNGTLTGFGRATLAFDACRFEGFTIGSTYWQQPGFLRFANCEIVTPDAKPFLTSAVYATGDMAFNQCRVSGGSPLMAVGDLRANKTGAASEAEPGYVSVSNTTYAAKAPFVVTRSKGKVGSPKKLVLTGAGNSYGNGAGFFDPALLPSAWTLK